MESKIEFRSSQNSTWVMRITPNKRIEVNEDVEVTEAAKLVLASMQNLLSQQRTWVGLNAGEVYDLYDSDYKVFYQRIECKLKEKNT